MKHEFNKETNLAVVVGAIMDKLAATTVDRKIKALQTINLCILRGGTVSS